MSGEKKEYLKVTIENFELACLVLFSIFSGMALNSVEAGFALFFGAGLLVYKINEIILKFFNKG